MGNCEHVAGLFLCDGRLERLSEICAGWRPNCQQNIHDSGRRREHSAETLSSSAASKDTVLFKVSRDAEAFYSIANSLPQVLGCSSASEIVDSYLNSATPEALGIFWDYNFFTRRRKHKGLDMPVLVISGGQDSMFSKEMEEDLAAVFPNAQHLPLPEAGHLMIAEYPDEVNGAIAHLITQLPKTR